MTGAAQGTAGLTFRLMMVMAPQTPWPTATTARLMAVAAAKAMTAVLMKLARIGTSRVSSGPRMAERARKVFAPA